MWKLEIATTIEALDAGEWDALNPDSPDATHGWLRLLEDEPARRQGLRYLTVRNEGRLRGAVVTRVRRPGDPAHSVDHVLLGPLRSFANRLGVSFLPTLLCLPCGLGRHLMLHPALEREEEERAATHLLGVIERIAREEELAITFPAVVAGEEPLESWLRGQGFGFLTNSAVSVLDVEWDSFEAYLASLRAISRKIPKSIKQNVRLNQRAGVELIEIEDPAPLAGRLHELAEEHFQRLNQRSAPYTTEFFESLRAELGAGAVIHGAWLKDALIGFCIVLQQGRRAHATLIGVDHERTRRNATYFQLAFNAPIRHAIANGIEQIEFGQKLEGLKTRRGCRLVPTSLAHRPATPAGRRVAAPWNGLLSLWYLRKRQAARTTGAPRS